MNPQNVLKTNAYPELVKDALALVALDRVTPSGNLYFERLRQVPTLIHGGERAFAWAPTLVSSAGAVSEGVIWPLDGDWESRVHFSGVFEEGYELSLVASAGFGQPAVPVETFEECFEGAERLVRGLYEAQGRPWPGK